MTFLHPETHIGLVALTVANRERSVAFYQDVLGFTVIERGNAAVILGAEATAPLLLVTENDEFLTHYPDPPTDFKLVGDGV